MATAPRNILLSGGARGIGRCMARQFLSKGHRVFILDIDKEELAHTINTHLKQYAPNVSSAICNLQDVPDIQAKVKQAADFFNGRIDVLVNNGGIAHPYWRSNATMADPSTLDQWTAYLSTNLTAPFAASQSCIPYMTTPAQTARDHPHAHHVAAPGPCIIHVSSFRALVSDPNQEGYAATKAGLLGLTHAMAVSLSAFGIRVNLVAPGRIRVAHECREADDKGTRWADTLEHEDVELHPANRAGRPEDVADAVEFLMNAGFVNGEALVVDGGASKVKGAA